MLDYQAEMAFPFERPEYESLEWLRAKNIFDFGTGNATYLKKLAKIFPDKDFVGCEIDKEMLQVARKNTEDSKNITILSADEVKTIKKNSIDFFIFRLVLLHVPDRSVAYELTKTIGRNDASILVIDAYDDYFYSNPEPKIFLQALKDLRSKSIDRNLFDKVESDLSAYQYKIKTERRIIINNSFPHANELMFKYMYCTAELGKGSPLSSEIQNDLIDWWLNPHSYIQYGVFSKLFVK